MPQENNAEITVPEISKWVQFYKVVNSRKNCSEEINLMLEEFRNENQKSAELDLLDNVQRT